MQWRSYTVSQPEADLIVSHAKNYAGRHIWEFGSMSPPTLVTRGGLPLTKPLISYILHLNE
jgi:hypothetical protein